MNFIAAPTDPTPFFGENTVSERITIIKDADTANLQDKYHQLIDLLEQTPDHVPEIRETYVVVPSSNRYRMVVRYRLYGPIPAPTFTI
jgi:hypothetical protein